MIPRANITAWRQQAPWSDDALVELDLVLSRVLIELYTDKLIASRLAFRGGTALHKLFLEPASRFSEDIDLVQIHTEPIGEIMSAIRNCLNPWLDEEKYKQGHGRVSLLYRFDSEYEPAGRRRLKIEINTREHFTALGLRIKRFQVSNPWFNAAADVTTYHLEELLGTKLRALYQRKKGRDLFDLSVALERADIDESRIVDCFLRYIEHDGLSVSRAQFEENLANKTNERSFLEDMEPLLGSGVQWESRAAIRAVVERILPKLPGNPWKGGR